MEGVKMPGRLDGLRPRKRKSSSRKASTPRSGCTKSPKTQPAAESSSVVGVCSKADVPLERLSRISCECHQLSGRRRCSASPELEGQEGKENELRTRPEPDSPRVKESEDMDCEETSKNIFPDDDSNQILPVEQFFGNLDAVQVRTSLRDRRRPAPVCEGSTGGDITTHQRPATKRRRASSV
ncbi:UPF0688 protein C1orf174 homolog isoform X3 [Anarhichas minor]|uniref:UPF0688 protein C1orf174 homolog isoform X3 n=1 Tax=Anarhichas minor TaxID=65739 RepID=UPI003F73E4DD